MSATLDPSLENFTFSLFGITFTLRVPHDKVKGLRESVAAIQAKTSQMMRENPNLNPQQAAILIALENESRLRAYLENSTPFERLAEEQINTIKATLERNLYGK